MITKMEAEFSNLDWATRDDLLQKALAKYDNEYFCPVCHSLLTGLHERTPHFVNRVNKEAAKLWKEFTK